ncbi:MAG: hypothetical protein VKJ64_20945 [Leptolyngbyaceae bacterium]|nr:hypothetical protein [Leptolyngbyaceae bacterium]
MTRYPQRVMVGGAIASLLFSLLALPTVANTLSTPIQGRQRYTVSSNAQPDRCGRANTQSRIVQLDVREALSQLTFTVTGNGGQPTLRVVDDRTGRETCVTADNLSGSRVDLTAAWEGNAENGRLYSVFVGDFNGETHDYTLTIQQN